MAGLFSKPKAPSLPPVPPPAAIPEVAPEAEAVEARRIRRTRGFRRTLITGALEPPATGKKTLLGG